MTPDNAADHQKFTELIKGFTVAVLTTRRNGFLRSRPMGTPDGHYDGALWFMTKSGSEKVTEINADPNVNVSYSDEGKERYITVCGRATIVNDQEKARQLWTPIAKAWFSGPDDPDLVLVRVEIDGAEYWDSPGGAMVAMFNMLKLAFTGEVADMGENRQMQLSSHQHETPMRVARGLGGYPNE